METTQLTTNVAITQPAIINMDGVVKLKADIEKIANAMETVEVTSENIQENKKLLANVRKEWQALETQRIAIKKEVLKPYDELDKVVKEMKAILEKGERNIASQLTAIREQERQEAIADLKELFDRNHKACNAPSWLSFEKFLERNMSLVNNKATSRVKKMNTLKEFFENYKNEYAKVKAKFPLEDERTAILLSYSTNGFDMPKAVEAYEAMIAEKERLHQQQIEAKKHAKPTLSINKKPEKKVETPVTATLEFVSEHEYMKALKALKDNNIKFVVK